MADPADILANLTRNRPAVPECPELISLNASELCITFPGPATMCVQMPKGISVNGYEQCKQLLAQVNAGILPLQSFFDILNSILCIQDVLQAIPDAITTADPGAVTDALEECAKRIEKLLGLLPPLVLPIFFCNVLDLIIGCLDGIAVELQRIINDQQRAINAEAIRAGMDADDPANSVLEQIIACANGIFDERAAGLNQGLGPINAFIAVLNALGQLIGAPEIPEIDQIGPELVQEVNRMQIVSDELRAIKAQIPGC